MTCSSTGAMTSNVARTATVGRQMVEEVRGIEEDRGQGDNLEVIDTARLLSAHMRLCELGRSGAGARSLTSERARSEA